MPSHNSSVFARSLMNSIVPETESHDPDPEKAKFTAGFALNASAWSLSRSTYNHTSASSETSWIVIGWATSLPAAVFVVSMTMRPERMISTTESAQVRCRYFAGSGSRVRAS